MTLPLPLPGHLERGNSLGSYSSSVDSYNDSLCRDSNGIGRYGSSIDSHNGSIGSHSDILGNSNNSISSHNNSLGNYNNIIGSFNNSIGSHKNSIGRDSISLGRNSSSIDRNSSSIDRNSSSIDRKSNSIDRNSSSIDRKSNSIDRNSVDRNSVSIGMECVGRDSKSVDRDSQEGSTAEAAATDALSHHDAVQDMEVDTDKDWDRDEETTAGVGRTGGGNANGDVEGLAPIGVTAQPMRVRLSDMHGFILDLEVADSVILSGVQRRSREQMQAWAEEERHRGYRWYTKLQKGGGIRSGALSLSGGLLGKGSIAKQLHVLGRRAAGSLSGSPQLVLNKQQFPQLMPSPSTSSPSSSKPHSSLAARTLSSSASFSSYPSSSSSSFSSVSTSQFSMPTTSSSLRSPSSALKSLIRRGIPPQLRPPVWMSVSGASKLKEEAGPGYYSTLLQQHQGIETESTQQIDNDVHRTFPGHVTLDTPEELAKLRRVLVAYSLRDSQVGYCQGMNYVAAYLLLVMRSEEDAFWVLCTLLERVLFDDCFTEDLFGCHVEQRVLKDLLKAKKPRLAEHLDSMGFELSLVATEWFLCLFAKSFPSETTFRIWDVLFHEGAKVLFRVALALFQINEEVIQATENIGDAVAVLVKSAARQYDPDVLLQVAFDKIGSFPMSSIKEKRRKQTPVVAAALELRQRQLSAYSQSRKQSGAASLQEASKP